MLSFARAGVRLVRLPRRDKFNPNHEPAGSPSGGQFAPADSGEGGGAPEPYHSTTTDQYGVTNDEYAKVQSWLGTGYRSLRTDPSFGKILEKLPLFNGKVYRGAWLRPEDYAKLTVGSTYEIGKYSSSSMYEEIADKFAVGQETIGEAAAARKAVVFEVYDRGRKIPKEYAEAAGVENEREVVLMTGDKYTIERVEPDQEDEEHSGSFTRVVMRHV